MGPEAAGPSPGLADRLADVHVDVRDDLDISRHVFRGEPSYVVHDPLTFQTHWLSPGDYAILVSLTSSLSLQQTFESLVEKGILEQDSREEFFAFVLSLHKRGLLQLPVNDDQSLYRRYLSRAKQRRQQLSQAVFFCQVPLWNPNQFLNRTMVFLRPLFSRGCFFAWCLLMALAGFVLMKNWDAFREPTAETLTLQNLPALWITLIVLKIAHEFGHAYACKHFGGHVPEMGVFLIVFTPCAYVDATASWCFSRKLHRLIVCFAGMYVELAIAAIALLAWSVMDPGEMKSIAHNVVLLASVVTLAFNVNPLMRFDGYYAFSDLVEVPNLRARSQHYALQFLRWIAIGGARPTVGQHEPRRLLLGFGVSASVYKIMVVLGISAVIATKYFLVGVLLGGLYIALEVFRIVSRLVPFLWNARESWLVRFRAATVSTLLFLILPAAAMMLPVSTTIRAPAVVSTTEAREIRSQTSGFVRDVPAIVGATVQANELLVALDDVPKKQALLAAIALRDNARIRLDSVRRSDPMSLEQTEHEARYHQATYETLATDVANLQVRSSTSGLLVRSLRPSDVGTYVTVGEPLALVAGGVPVVRAYLTEAEVARTQPKVGQEARFRLTADPSTTRRGTITGIRGTASRRVADAALGQEGTGEIAMAPGSLETTQPYLEITVCLEDPLDQSLRYGGTGRVELVGEEQTVADTLVRKVLLFLQQLKTA